MRQGKALGLVKWMSKSVAIMRKQTIARMRKWLLRKKTPRTSFIPYGYRLTPKGKLVIQPEEVKVIKRIFENYCGCRRRERR